MSWTPNCKAGGLNLHCLCVVGFISSLISARMQHSDENVARLAQVIFGEKASWWTWGQLERWQAHQVGASRNLNNFAQVVQAYTVQAQAYLYNTYTSNLYKHIMQACQVLHPELLCPSCASTHKLHNHMLCKHKHILCKQLVPKVVQHNIFIFCHQ